jgi:rRNA-processing protein FCF1
MTVVMDTSALMMPVECNVRVFEELDRLLGGHEPAVPRAVIEELEKLAAGNGKEAAAAGVGHDLAVERCQVLDHEESYADDALVEVASEGRCEYVVTNDRDLRERLLGEDVPVISLRGQNKLAITQP